MTVILIAPRATPLVPYRPGALMFVVMPASELGAPPMSVSVKMELNAKSIAVVPSADPSFHCISRPALWFNVDRPDWAGEAGVGIVRSSTYVARGTITRSSQ